MSGDIKLEISAITDEFDETAKSLQCPRCMRQMREPKILSCLHSFCQTCLPEGSGSPTTGIKCPICNNQSHSCDDDEILTYLLSQKDSPNFDLTCANCESQDNERSMFFCETCSQLLCNDCKISTHSARMFISHKIKSCSNCMVPNLCPEHPSLPLVIVNTVTNELFCIQCFSTVSQNVKSNCVDLYTAVDRRNSEIAILYNRMKDISVHMAESISTREDEWHYFQTSHEKKTEEVILFADSMIAEIQAVRDKLVADLVADLSYKNNKLECAKLSVKNYCELFEKVQGILSVFENCQDTQEFFKISQKLGARFRAIIAAYPDISPLSAKNLPYNSKSAFLSIFKNAFSDYQLSRNHRSPTHRPNTSRGAYAATSRESSSNESMNMCFSGMEPSERPGVATQVVVLEQKTRDLKFSLQENIKRVQSLQLDITKRKSYPKRQEVEKFVHRISDFNHALEKLSSEVREGSESVNKDSGMSPEMKDLSMAVCSTIQTDCEDIKTKHEQMYLILQSILPYITCVTTQKEKTNERLVPTPHVDDYLHDIKHNYQVTSETSEQRLSAIEAQKQQRSQIMQDGRNQPVIERELILAKEKLKKPTERSNSGCSSLPSTVYSKYRYVADQGGST